MSDASAITAPTAHTSWLEAWQGSRNQFSSLADDSPDEFQLHDDVEALSVRLASTEAETTEDLIAQVTWLKTELEDVVATWASPEHAQVFDLILKSLTKKGEVPTV